MGDAGDKKTDSVKVAVRLRPLSNKELGNNESSIIELEENSAATGNGSVIINDPAEKDLPSTFAFDLVFGLKDPAAVQQETLFQAVGKPALDQTMTGYNGTIFAYGQTGSGKSWSMTGGSGDLKGIIPRVNDELFIRVAEEQEKVSTRRFLVMCSFFEIYNEIIFDLLNPVQDRSKLGAGLQVKEHPVLGIYVKDLSEIVVGDSNKLSMLMDSGTKNRAVSSTMMNASSSRSHSIFTIKVHQKDEEDKSRNVFAKLNLVDLAGSERQRGTGASGATLKEGANINKSLSALGNVINALVENANGKKVFVPFRNSKLTRVLQESLGGNSLCTMLATLSPAACNYEETLSTLRYANRAKAIKVNATKNEEASQISRLNAEIEELKKKLVDGGGGGGGGGDALVAEEERNEMKAKFQAQLSDMQKMVSSTWEEKTRVSSDQESQLTKALEEQRRQAQAMQEECHKRFRLLKDQDDLELSVRGLLDTVLWLKPKVPGGAASTPLCAGDLPRQWLKAIGAIGEVTDHLKQQRTMALVFHGSFRDDLQLWVDGEVAQDGAGARTGARRALTNLETLRRECEKLARLEAEGRAKLQEFLAAVREALREWSAAGADAVRAALREAGGGDGAEEGAQDATLEGGLPPIYVQTLEDIERILRLLAQQAEGKAAELSAQAGLVIGQDVELLLRGAGLVQGASVEGPDLELLRSVAQEDGGPAAAAAQSAPPTPAGAPREARALHEWTPADVDDTVEGTESVLSRLVDLEELHKKRSPLELLARPPPKFVHDVACLIKQATGFPQTMGDDWPDPREGKIEVLQHICDSAASTLFLESIEFDPENVLKGKEVPQTLRLLQLLAVAAAKDVRARDAADGIEAPDDRGKAKKLTHASEMPQVLEAIARCVQLVVEQHSQRSADDGQTSPTTGLESTYRALQEKLQEEVAARTRREETIARLQHDVSGTRQVLQEGYVQLEQAKKAAVDVSARKCGMLQSVEALRHGLLERAQQVQGDPQVDRMRGELKDLAARYSSKSTSRVQLTADLRSLQERQLEIKAQTETAELEMRRFRLRLAEGLVEGPKGDAQQSEEILLLQSEKQKLDVRIAALDDKMRTIAEMDDAERNVETGIMEEKKLHGGKHDEVQMQMQVARDERDDLREGMDILWQEKTVVEEELEYLSSGYVDLSERLMSKEDEARELEEQLNKYEDILRMLRQNAEKSRHSPGAAAKASSGAARAGAAAGAPNDDAASQYSDDFEELDGEED